MVSRRIAFHSLLTRKARIPLFWVAWYVHGELCDRTIVDRAQLHPTMKLSAALGFLPHFWFVLRISVPDTIRAVMLSPSLLLKPTLVSRISMTFVWQLFGNALDENGREVKADLMTQSAHGLVLDLGAGAQCLLLER